MQVPRLEKIVLNMGVGEAVNDRKKVDSAAGDLALIAGQRPVQTKSRMAIATVSATDTSSFSPRSSESSETSL